MPPDHQYIPTASASFVQRRREREVGWRFEPVCRQSTKTLDAWSVYEVPFECLDAPWTRHLVGFRLEDCKGHVSSLMETFDPMSQRVITRSGQEPTLRRPPK